MPQLLCGSSPSWQEVLDQYAKKMNIGKMESKLIENNENNTEKTDLQLSEKHSDIACNNYENYYGNTSGNDWY